MALLIHVTWRVGMVQGAMEANMDLTVNYVNAEVVKLKELSDEDAVGANLNGLAP